MFKSLKAGLLTFAIAVPMIMTPALANTAHTRHNAANGTHNRAAQHSTHNRDGQNARTDGQQAAQPSNTNVRQANDGRNVNGTNTDGRNAQGAHVNGRNNTGAHANGRNTNTARNNGRNQTHRPFIRGYEDGNFHPDRALTRAEFSKMLHNLYGDNAHGRTSTRTANTATNRTNNTGVTNRTTNTTTNTTVNRNAVNNNVDGRNMDGRNVDGRHADGRHMDGRHVDGYHSGGRNMHGRHTDGNYVPNFGINTHRYNDGRTGLTRTRTNMRNVGRGVNNNRTTNPLPLDNTANNFDILDNNVAGTGTRNSNAYGYNTYNRDGNRDGVVRNTANRVGGAIRNTTNRVTNNGAGYSNYNYNNATGVIRANAAPRAMTNNTTNHARGGYRNHTANAGRTFGNVSANHWARNEIHGLHGMGYFSAIDGDSFRADEAVTRTEFFAVLSQIKGQKVTDSNNSGSATITRGEAVAELHKLEGRPTEWTGNMRFNDVHASHPHHRHIMHAVNGH
ncbi:MAG: S-layer homology domain-containing protein [Oscillospiraceae bacterium]|nr:S-layer homology domain-containing protein [Oscillospiraceae bacterium]